MERRSVRSDEALFPFSLLLSAALHGVCMFLFTFVVRFDIEHPMPAREITYIGRLAAHPSVLPESSFPPVDAVPAVNLPLRTFAEESVNTDASDLRPLRPTTLRKLVMLNRDEEDIYALKPSMPDLVDQTGKRRRSSGSLKRIQYMISGDLAGRKITLKPPVPAYPEWAEREGIEADMKVRIVVDADGMVEKVESLQSTGFPRMDMLATNYLRQWRFERRPGEKKRQTGLVLIRFRLK